jgi:hypothetical protein
MKANGAVCFSPGPGGCFSLTDSDFAGMKMRMSESVILQVLPPNEAAFSHSERNSW